MRWFLVLAVAVLASCSTPQSLMETKPRLEFLTVRPPKEAASIISTGWSAHTANLSTQLRGDGFLLILGPSALDAVAQIQPEGTGSHVQYWQRPLILPPAWMEDEVRKCMD